MHLSHSHLQENVFISTGKKKKKTGMEDLPVGWASYRVRQTILRVLGHLRAGRPQKLSRKHKAPGCHLDKGRTGYLRPASLHHEAGEVYKRALMVQCQRVPS